MFVITDTTWYPLTWSNPPYQQVDNVVCTGTEPQLSDCSFNVTSTDTSTAVKVSCEYSKKKHTWNFSTC